MSLIMLQLLDWIEVRPRTYSEAMEAWRTSCPRLSVWEDALIEGLIELQGEPSRPAMVVLTTRGKAALQSSRIGKSM